MWWVDISGNVRAWVVNAEQDCHAYHFSRLLWGGSADHVEVKVVGRPARAAVHFLLPDSEPLETLADMVDTGQCLQLKLKCTFSELSTSLLGLHTSTFFGDHLSLAHRERLLLYIYPCMF